MLCRPCAEEGSCSQTSLPDVSPASTDTVHSQQQQRSASCAFHATGTAAVLSLPSPPTPTKPAASRLPTSSSPPQFGRLFLDARLEAWLHREETFKGSRNGRMKGWKDEGKAPSTRFHSLQDSAVRRCAQLSPTHLLIPAPGTLCFLNSLLKGKKRGTDQNKYGSLDLARVSERNRVVVLTGGGWNSLGSAERLSLCSLSPSHGAACGLIAWFRHKYIILKWATLSGENRFTGCLSEVNDLRVRCWFLGVIAAFFTPLFSLPVWTEGSKLSCS